MKRAVLLFVFLLPACTTIPPAINQSTASQPDVFSHQSFDRVLQHRVDHLGRVDYQALQKQPDEFEAYYQLISHYSPDSHPELFLSEQDRLAYWINAYNTAVIKIVLTYYPITGIEDVTPPLPLFFLPNKFGFFFFQRPVFGRVSTSLYYLENSVIRERFLEPRMHFALNCASRGCPRLPNYAFTGDRLDHQLENEAKRFFAEERNLKIDAEQKTIYLSSIMDWFRDDFIDWYQLRHPESDASLVDFVALYAPENKAVQLKENAKDYRVEFVPYDWTLNDQNAPN